MNNITVTKDIELKPVTLDMASSIFQIFDLERASLRVWLPFIDYTEKEEDTFQYLTNVINENQKQFGIYYKGSFAGLIGFVYIDEANRKCEIGYWISQQYEGKGIITQSVDQLIRHLFNDLKMNKVAIKVAVNNIKSRKVPERLNFTLEGIERDGELLVDNQFTDLALYGLLKNEFIEK